MNKIPECLGTVVWKCFTICPVSEAQAQLQLCDSVVCRVGVWQMVISFLHLFSNGSSGLHSPRGLPWLLVTILTQRSIYSLTLIDSSLPSEAEPELRTYISRRLSKGALLGGMGNIATVELRYLFDIFSFFHQCI